MSFSYFALGSNVNKCLARLFRLICSIATCARFIEFISLPSVIVYHIRVYINLFLVVYFNLRYKNGFPRNFSCFVMSVWTTSTTGLDTVLATLGTTVPTSNSNQHNTNNSKNHSPQYLLVQALNGNLLTGSGSSGGSQSPQHHVGNHQHGNHLPNNHHTPSQLSYSQSSLNWNRNNNTQSVYNHKVSSCCTLFPFHFYWLRYRSTCTQWNA